MKSLFEMKLARSVRSTVPLVRTFGWGSEDQAALQWRRRVMINQSRKGNLGTRKSA
jgi:hypothetical protein